MNKQGAIGQFETTEDAEKAGYRTNLTPAETSHLSGKNRHERRAELARMRCDARKANRRGR